MSIALFVNPLAYPFMKKSIANGDLPVLLVSNSYTHHLVWLSLFTQDLLSSSKRKFVMAYPAPDEIVLDVSFGLDVNELGMVALLLLLGHTL
jgi:hypothetical protein